jgi:hypothetical protein
MRDGDDGGTGRVVDVVAARFVVGVVGVVGGFGRAGAGEVAGGSGPVGAGGPGAVDGVEVAIWEPPHAVPPTTRAATNTSPA